MFSVIDILNILSGNQKFIYVNILFSSIINIVDHNDNILKITLISSQSDFKLIYDAKTLYVEFRSNFFF